MSKLLRIFLISLGTLVALIAVVIGALVVIIDPQDYRESIESAMQEATGLRLDIAGGVSLTYRPYVGLVLNDVRLRNPQRPQELASSPQIMLQVDPRALLSGRLQVEALRASSFHVNYYVDADGNSLWLTERLRQLAANGTAPAGGDSPALGFNLAFVSISNASVDIQNLQQGYYYTLQDLRLDSQNSNLNGDPFPLQASFQLAAPTAPLPWPVTLSSNTTFDLGAGALALTDIQLALTPARFDGELSWQNLYGESSWQARFSSSQFALDDLWENLFSAPADRQRPQLPGVSQNQAWQTRLEGRLQGDQNTVELSQLSATLGEMNLTMSGDLRYANGLLPANARFTIETGALDLSPYLAASATPLPADQPAATGTEPTPGNPLLALQIPASLRSGMNVQGTVTLASLSMGGLQFGTANLFTNLESGVLDVELQPTSLLGGELLGNLRINSIPARSEVSLDLYANALNSADLDLPLVEPGTLAGSLSQESHFTGAGTTLGEWLDSFRGATAFRIPDSSVDIGIIKQVFTSIAVLSPTGERIQNWPDVIRLNALSGYVLFENGLDSAQQIKLRMDNFDIEGSGGIDLVAQRFDYDLMFTLRGEPGNRTIAVDPRYYGVSWPVECSAGFEEPRNRYCRPDLAQVRAIFGQLEDTVQAPVTTGIEPEPESTMQLPEALLEINPALLQNLFPPSAFLIQPDVDQSATPDSLPGQGAPAADQGFPAAGQSTDAPGQAIPSPGQSTDAPGQAIPAPGPQAVTPDRITPAPAAGSSLSGPSVATPARGTPIPDQGIPNPNQGTPSPFQ